MPDSLSPADLAVRLREHDAAMPKGQWVASDQAKVRNSHGMTVAAAFSNGADSTAEYLAICPGIAFLRNHAATNAGHLERLAALEAAGLEECLSMIRKRLIAHGCQCGPGVHEATPPMCYDDWISCAIKAAVAKVEAERDALRAELDRLRSENERLRLRILTAAGDDLCRLTPEEIKELSSGGVKIPPEEEFLASCKRFHKQIASTSGVLGGCLTLAQMVAENESLRAELDRLREPLTKGERAAVADLIADFRALKRDCFLNDEVYDLCCGLADALESSRTEIESLKSQIRKGVFDFSVIENLRLQEIAALRSQYDAARLATGKIQHPDGGPECDGCGCSQLTAEEAVIYMQRDYEAEIAALRTERAWRPMETHDGPKPGFDHPVLVFIPEVGVITAWKDNGRWFRAIGKALKPPYLPTHWQPLTTPPEQP